MTGSHDRLERAITAGSAADARHALESVPPGDPESLQLLATHAATGARTATELFVERLYESGVITAFVRGSLFDENAIEDVTQETLISVAQSITSFRGDSKITTWIHQIVRKRVADHLRRMRSTSPLPDDDLAPSERISSMIASRVTVRDALASLPERYRAPVTMRDIEGLSYAEVSDRLGRNVGTVKAQIARGRAMLAGAVGADRGGAATTGREQ